MSIEIKLEPSYEMTSFEQVLHQISAQLKVRKQQASNQESKNNTSA